MAKTTKTPARKPAAAKVKAATDNRRITIPPAVDDELGALWDAFWEAHPTKRVNT